ncbi:transcriptional regulator BetI [Pseudooceanicola nanhaiensis]|uniref:transcriptional regulator BetI n=1 Tax=Pseudooceanicola nanhaiensis TaxID=375761 RepID=UPI001CD41B79|nr:transcriptional regulator BetI [Pseudooceanicola nanhaiensis]MCA0920348.1 transcriptional regulator BetI [Pseudooceanicola nanhaiensis]
MGRKSIADIRRTELAQAAFEVLAEHGLQGTTLQRVAAHTGASKASVLHYYATKQALIEAALRKGNSTLREEAVLYMRLAQTPWERFYAIIEANFSPTTYLPRMAHGWVAMCAEVPHNPQFARLQRVIYRRLNGNLRSALIAVEPDADAAERGANMVSLLIDGIWLRLGMQVGGLSREEALDHLESHLAQRYGTTPERLAARARMAEVAATLAAKTV